MREVCQVHPYKPDGLEILDVADRRAVIDRYLELIPADLLIIAIAQTHGGGADVGDVVLPYVHLLWGQLYLILEVLLKFIKRVVLVDVLHVGHTL